MDDCLSARVQQQFSDALVVHRLDMATSGLIVMARGIEMQRMLSAAFAARQVHKRYEAVVAGQMDAPLGSRRSIWPAMLSRVSSGAMQASAHRRRTTSSRDGSAGSRLSLWGSDSSLWTAEPFCCWPALPFCPSPAAFFWALPAAVLSPAETFPDSAIKS